MPRIFRFLENINRYARTRWNHEKLTDRFAGHNKTRRRFHRHSLLGLEGSFVRIKGEVYPLNNISYGGTSIYSTASLFLEHQENRKPMKGLLSVLGITCEVKLSVLYFGNGTVGLAFDESDEILQKYLEETIYYLDCGLVLKRLSRNIVSHFFQGPSWNSYGNENINPEVHIKFGPQGELEEVNVSYLSGFRREFVVFSYKATTVSTVPEKRLSLTEKKLILRNSLLLIIGFRQIGNTDRFDQLIKSAIDLLKKQSKSRLNQKEKA